MNFAAAMLIAMAIDAAVGWPDWLYRRIGHPVTWLGRLVNGLERELNRGAPMARRVSGVAILAIATLIFAGVPTAVLAFAPSGIAGTVVAGILAWPLIAIRSMREHVEAVAEPLEARDIKQARHAVSMIVGRDPQQLDEAGVASAAIESLAENTSDGIVAPVFWGVVLGLPGIAAYKAVNTLDSMIGHKNERYEDFGWASARFDDLVNLLPARLTGFLFAMAGGAPLRSLAAMWRDAGKHRSPNAGWPESAMAGALGVRLSGPRAYHGRMTNEPWVNAQGRDPGVAELRQGLAIYRRALIGLAAMVAIVAAAGW